jgi:hypothetical protein
LEEDMTLEKMTKLVQAVLDFLKKQAGNKLDIPDRIFARTNGKTLIMNGSTQKPLPKDLAEALKTAVDVDVEIEDLLMALEHFSFRELRGSNYFTVTISTEQFD